VLMFALAAGRPRRGRGENTSLFDIHPHEGSFQPKPFGPLGSRRRLVWLLRSIVGSRAAPLSLDLTAWGITKQRIERVRISPNHFAGTCRCGLDRLGVIRRDPVGSGPRRPRSTPELGATRYERRTSRSKPVGPSTAESSRNPTGRHGCDDSGHARFPRGQLTIMRSVGRPRSPPPPKFAGGYHLRSTRTSIVGTFGGGIDVLGHRVGVLTRPLWCELV
jgi:hypothetical protein